MSFHTINILIHITAACLALIGGLVLLTLAKGTRRHRAIGRVVAILVAIALVAAWIGALVFRGKADLVGVTLLVSYLLWSGPRALRLKDNGRRLADLLPALVMLAAAVAMYLLYRSGAAFNWGPQRVYASIGSMVFYGGWDVLRTGFPVRWRLWLNPAEHAFRMTSIIGALVSVAFGTVLKSQGVYASLAASTLFVVLAGVFAVRAALRAARQTDGVTPSASRNARLNTDSEL